MYIIGENNGKLENIVVVNQPELAGNIIVKDMIKVILSDRKDKKCCF